MGAALEIILERMPRRGLVPDAACISAALVACERAGDVGGAAAVLEAAMRRYEDTDRFDKGLDLRTLSGPGSDFLRKALPVTSGAESVRRL